MSPIKLIAFALAQSIIFCLGFILIPVRYVYKIIFQKTKFSLWTGTPIITMTHNARAERLLGTDAKSLVYSPYYTTSNFDYNLSRFCSNPILKRLVPLVTFMWASVCADRLHFYCDTGLLSSKQPFSFNFLELYIYKILQIEVFLWTYGADVRSREITISLGEPNCCTECTLIEQACVCDETRRRRNMEKLKQYSTAIFSMGDMIEYTPGSRNDLFFWPVELQGANANKYNPVYYPQLEKDKPVCIVHAPNHRMFKGTNFLIKAVENLRAEGIPVELILVEKVPNEKALDIYRSADIIFDQCLIGFHGYFALEGMAMGKPVMCFIRKPEYLLHPEECPIINTHIATLENDIRQLVENREQLKEIGMRGRQYIEKYFTLEAFALRLKNAYDELGIAV